MAQAVLVMNENDGFDGTKVVINPRVIFTGADIPGGYAVSFFSIPVDVTVSASQFHATLDAAIRAEATRLGFSVPTNNILKQSWVRS